MALPEYSPSAPPLPSKNTITIDFSKVKNMFRKIIKPKTDDSEIGKTLDFHMTTLDIASKRRDELEKKQQELQEELAQTTELLNRTKEILKAFSPRNV